MSAIVSVMGNRITALKKVEEKFASGSKEVYIRGFATVKLRLIDCEKMTN